MNYLFGDSTAAPFSTNVLEFLRDAIDFSVYVLEADLRIIAGSNRVEARHRQADTELDEIEALGRAVTETIESTPKGASDSPASECALRMVTACDEAVRMGSTSVRERLASDVHQAEVEEAAEREGCVKALMQLLIPHPPPDSTAVLKVKLREAGGYDASILGSCSTLGLTWQCELGFPERHLLREMVWLGQIWPTFEIAAPELTGWIKKEVKMRPQHLERLCVTEIAAEDSKVAVHLRMDPESPVGFDLELESATSTLTVSRAAQDEDPTGGPFDVLESDAPKLIELCRTLQASLGELRSVRLVEAKLNGDDFRELSSFSLIVKQVVAQLAPMAHEVARHSLEPNELVLRRPLANDRREEIFVSKSTLRQKYAELPAELRALFEPLGLHMSLSRSLVPPPDPASSTAAKRSELRQSRPPLPPPRPLPPIAIPPAAKPSDAGPASSVQSEAQAPGSEARASDSRVEASTSEARGPDGAETLDSAARALDSAWGLDPPSRDGDPATERNESLMAALEKIVLLAKAGDVAAAYREYTVCLDASGFPDYPPADQRRALKLLVLLGSSSSASEATDQEKGAVRAAHRAARDRALELTRKHDDPADYELLGLCQIALDQPRSATETFRKALEMERARNPQSELCERLSKRLSSNE